MPLSIKNPYRNDVSSWLKGNLHAHTTNSDGRRSPQEVVDEYAKSGYAFLMISDHDFLTDPSGVDARGMVLIPGSEITAEGPHVLHVNAESTVAPNADRQIVIDEINADGAFAVVAHPNWEKNFAHCPQEKLEAWQGYIGIEVYNGVIRRLDGSPLATDRWDRLLGLGRRVWGFAHDDSHRSGDDGIAWIMVQAENRSLAGILEALRNGAFYASTGVTIETIRVSGKTIEVQTRDADRLIAYSDFGHRELTVDGPRLAFTVSENSTIKYVRVECWGRGECMAWTQPFYIEGV
ncbi:MAG: CehA/McbA family metallohydrolase [Candidatus Hydrogenedentes bacterium]|nr:CehA/McbA family metallohydrolase [Candidatus Hydrogenedentota bacterium]